MSPFIKKPFVWNQPPGTHPPKQTAYRDRHTTDEGKPRRFLLWRKRCICRGKKGTTIWYFKIHRGKPRKYVGRVDIKNGDLYGACLEYEGMYD